MCKATDLGFPVFVLLTTDNVVLQQQTLDRVKADLEGYCICGENDAKIFADNSLMLPTIVVLKKNARILKLWANIFNSTGFMRGNPLFIVDDEADAASLNKSFISIIDVLLAESPTTQGILIVRRNRDIAQGTGALLSPNDWQLGGSFPRKIVLTMYQVTGTKGWGGKQLWVPNIKLPEGSVYYDVIED